VAVGAAAEAMVGVGAGEEGQQWEGDDELRLQSFSDMLTLLGI